MELLQALGLDYKILIAQVVNFAILLLILYKIGYQPILKFVHDRTTTIERGVQQALEAKTALTTAKSEHTRIVQEAKQAAQQVLDEAKTQAQVQGQTLIERSKSEAQKVIVKAKQDIRLEHATMVTEARREIAQLVVFTTERVLRKKITSEEDKMLIEKTLTQLR